MSIGNGHAAGSTVRITGVGAKVPSRVVTSVEVEERAGLARFGFPRGWLEEITGVRERRWAEPDVTPSELAAAAAGMALADAGCDPADVDTLIFTGITRDCLEPAVANIVADVIGAHRARVFDVVNACNGVVDGIDVADSLIRSGKARRVLVATGERASLGIGWAPQTREAAVRGVASLCVSDGGAAVLVEPSDDPGRGIRTREYRSNATQWRHAVGGQFHCGAGGGPTGATLFDPAFSCHGRGLFEASFNLLFPMIATVMERSGWTFKDLDVIFCHLPSRRFTENAVGLDGTIAKYTRKLWSSIDRYGNMSTCTLPLAMSEAKAAGVLAPGARVLMLAPCSGVSAAAMTMVW